MDVDEEWWREAERLDETGTSHKPMCPSFPRPTTHGHPWSSRVLSKTPVPFSLLLITHRHPPASALGSTAVHDQSLVSLPMMKVEVSRETASRVDRLTRGHIAVSRQCGEPKAKRAECRKANADYECSHGRLLRGAQRKSFILSLSLTSPRPPKIVSHMEPKDLLQLSRASKELRVLLLSNKNTRHLWVAARNNVVPPLPDCPEDMSEPRYAFLVFERFCEVEVCPTRHKHTSEYLR